MSADLVKRLRRMYGDPLVREAAAEIDRLRVELIETRGRGWQLQSQTMEAENENDQLRAALKTARKALETISDNGGDTLTIEDAVRIADTALASLKPRTDPDHPSWNELIEDDPKP
jgi:small-conductance mechanosensitive channel